MQHSILYLFNPNNFLKIRNKSNQTKIKVFSDLYNLKKLTKKKKKKQISKIEKTNILIENPKTQNKNESNLNLPNKKNSIKSNILYPKLQNWEKIMYCCRCRFWRSGSLNLARERMVMRIVFVVRWMVLTNSALFPFWL